MRNLIITAGGGNTVILTAAQPHDSNRDSSTAAREEPSQERNPQAVNRSRCRCCCCCCWKEIHQRLSSGCVTSKLDCLWATAVGFVAARRAGRRVKTVPAQWGGSYQVKAQVVSWQFSICFVLVLFSGKIDAPIKV